MTTPDIYQARNDGRAQGETYARQLEMAGDLHRHEQHLNAHDSELRTLVQAVNALTISVQYQSRTPFVLALVALGLTVLAMIGVAVLLIAVF